MPLLDMDMQYSYNIILIGFIKSTDYRPTDHLPLTHRPPDPPTTNLLTHRPKIHRPTDKILFQRLDN